jgi:cellulose synthase operon protein C
MRFAPFFALPLSLVVCAASCAPRVGALSPSAVRDGGSALPALPDAQFGPAVAEVLRGAAFPGAAPLGGARGESPSVGRATLLAQVFAVQLQRAAGHLKAGRTAQGLAWLRGAFLLAVQEDFQDSLFSGTDTTALQLGANAFSQTGDEGPAEALYGLVVRFAPSGPERESARAHLEALRRWQQDTREPGTLDAQGLAQHAAQARAMLLPTRENVAAARAETLRWVARADELRDTQVPPRTLEEKEDLEAAFRASTVAPWLLTALYLRAGDAAGALAALRENQLDRRVPAGLVQLLQLAAERDDARAWAELSQNIRGAEVSDDNPSGLAPDLVAGASFGAALRLYRARPAEFGAAVALSLHLLGVGLVEAAPALLGPALSPTSEPRERSFALQVVLQGLLQADAVGDVEGARRLYEQAAPLLLLTDAVAKEVRPRPGEIAYAMGEIEARAGSLAQALVHLRRAVADRPTVPALNLIASISRQQGNADEALQALDRAAELAQSEQNRAALAEALISRFEVLREQSASKEAAEALKAALDAALGARQSARQSPELARAERALARTLELFNAPDAARRAGRRAFEASRSDPEQLTATVLDSSRRALTAGDLQAAREAVRQALSADLPDEDTVYAALWLKLLERRLAVHSDGTAEEALAGIEEESGWVAKLTAWGRGRLTDDALRAAATSVSERVEAEFYTAMANRDPGAVQDRLQGVARSEAIQLIEVVIARDLIAAGHSERPRLPADLQLP